MRRLRKSAGTWPTAQAPEAAPMAVKRIPQRHSFSLTAPPLQKWKVALPDPETRLKLVGSQRVLGDQPRPMSTGIVMRPPPPAMVSAVPAKSAVRKSAGVEPKAVGHSAAAGKEQERGTGRLAEGEENSSR